MRGSEGQSSENSKWGNNFGAYQIYSGGSERYAQQQSRSGQYCQDKAFQGLQEKISAFNKDTKDSLGKLAQINKEHMEVVNKEYQSTTKVSMADNFWR